MTACQIKRNLNCLYYLTFCLTKRDVFEVSKLKFCIARILIEENNRTILENCGISEEVESN